MIDIYEVVVKIVGPIDPVGETTTDDARFENLKAITDLVEKLLVDINYVGMQENRHEYSRSRAGKFAKEFQDSVGIFE